MNQVLEELTVKIHYDVDKASINNYLATQKKVNRSTKQMVGLTSTLGKVMKGLFIGSSAFFGIKGLIETYRNFDMVQRSLNALTGSAELGAEHFEFLKRAAMQTGTGIMEVAKAYRGYYYAAKTAGLADDELQHSFLGVMIGARILGANKQQVGGAMLALEQMLNKTTVQAQEMNLQLGNAISGAKEMAAEAMGMTVPEFVEKMQKKMINSAEFVKKFGDYMYQTFINKLPEAMKSLDASVINLENAWLIFQHEIMKGGFGEELTKLNAQLIKVLLSPEAKSFAKALGEALNLIGKAVAFLVKNFKMILLLWGANSLLQGFMKFNQFRTIIQGLAMDIALGARNMGLLNNAVMALDLLLSGNIVGSLKLIGKTGKMVGRSFLWITLIAIALGAIALIIQDIWTYFAHPEANSIFKQLIEESPILKDMVEDIKNTFLELKPTLEDIGKEFGNAVKMLIELGKYGLPLVKMQLQMTLGILISIMWVLTKIIDLINIIKGAANPEIPDVKEAEEGFKHATEISAAPKKTWRQKAFGWMKGFAENNSLTFAKPPEYDRYYGGMDLTKTENNTNSTVNNNKIYIDAKQKTDKELVDLFTSAMNGDIANTIKWIDPKATPSIVRTGGN